MNSFSVTRKKTPFQKHREKEEAKKKRAEDETARLYAEFLEAFQSDNTPGTKTFVRGGTINPNDKLKNDFEDMFHHSYRLLWQPKEANLGRRRRKRNQRRMKRRKSQVT